MTERQVSAGGLSSRQSSGHPWTKQQCHELQEVVDQIFGKSGRGEELRRLKFSLTIADPSLPDCPLIGCSDGFCDLTGYDMDTIVGQNCRFLIDPVPVERIEREVRVVAKDFIEAVRKRETYKMPEHLRRPFMPKAQHSDCGVFCLQTNARKDGSLFKNMFYMKEIEVEQRPYIIGLQTEVHEQDLDLLHEACQLLDRNMLEVQRTLSSKFWCAFAMDRLDEADEFDGFVQVEVDASKQPMALKPIWTDEQAQNLQGAIDKIFGASAGKSLQELHLSLTIADPTIQTCPLIGCSTGFTRLCGYEMADIIGHNCRFLVEPVPNQLVNSKVKRLAREYCEQAACFEDYSLKDSDREPWMPPARHSDDGLFLVQRNARKDGSLFSNMFYLRRVELDGRPFVLGLQTALPPDALTPEGAEVSSGKMEACHKACRILDDNMNAVERLLAGQFWYMGPMRRQEDHEEDGFEGDEAKSADPPLLPDRGLCIRSVLRKRICGMFSCFTSKKRSAT